VLASRRLAQQAAYLVLVSAGILLTAFGLGGTAALAAGLYYLAHTTLAAASLFLFADVLNHARGDLGDRLVAGPSLPQGQLLGGLFLLIALAVTGVPPLSGFIGKFLILQSSIGDPWMSWVIGVVLITSLLGIMALARSGSQLFFKVDGDAAVAAATRPIALIAPALLVSAGIGLVVYAGPVYEFTKGAAAQLVEPGGYVAAVLQTGREGAP
jgi:multicomponent K+:H+ antiporter subunit D